MSRAWVPSQIKWLAMRCNSVRIVRTTRARGGASATSNFSTASQYPNPLETAAT